LSVSLAFEKGQDRQKLFVEIEQELLMSARCGTMFRGNDWRLNNFPARYARCCRRSAAVLSSMLCEVLARARNRKAFFVEQALDFKDCFDILAAVKAVAAGALYRLKRWELGLPIAQDEGFRRRQAADFPDAKETLLRNFVSGLRCTRHIFSVS